MLVTRANGGGSSTTPGVERAASTNIAIAAVGGAERSIWTGTLMRWNRSGGSGDDLTTLFDDESPTANGRAGTTASQLPFSPLSAFDGLNLDSNWTLLIRDQVAGDSGTLFDWHVEGQVTPEPGTAMLLGLGLVGLARARRRA